MLSFITHLLNADYLVKGDERDDDRIQSIASRTRKGAFSIYVALHERVTHSKLVALARAIAECQERCFNDNDNNEMNVITLCVQHADNSSTYWCNEDEKMAALFDALREETKPHHLTGFRLGGVIGPLSQCALARLFTTYAQQQVVLDVLEYDGNANFQHLNIEKQRDYQQQHDQSEHGQSEQNSPIMKCIHTRQFVLSMTPWRNQQWFYSEWSLHYHHPHWDDDESHVKTPTFHFLEPILSSQYLQDVSIRNCCSIINSNNNSSSTTTNKFLYSLRHAHNLERVKVPFSRSRDFSPRLFLAMLESLPKLKALEASEYPIMAAMTNNNNNLFNEQNENDDDDDLLVSRTTTGPVSILPTLSKLATSLPSLAHFSLHHSQMTEMDVLELGPILRSVKTFKLGGSFRFIQTQQQDYDFIWTTAFRSSRIEELNLSGFLSTLHGTQAEIFTCLIRSLVMLKHLKRLKLSVAGTLSPEQLQTLLTVLKGNDCRIEYVDLGLEKILGHYCPFREAILHEAGLNRLDNCGLLKKDDCLSLYPRALRSLKRERLMSVAYYLIRERCGELIQNPCNY